MEEPSNQKSVIEKPKEETFKKTTEKSESYSLNIKIQDNSSIYISITIDDENKVYEDIKSLEDIKKQQTYFEDYSLEEIYHELLDLISKNSFEFNKNNGQILFTVVLSSMKRKTLDFVLEIEKSKNIMKNTLLQQIINQKVEDIIKKQDKIIEQKDEVIKKQEEVIKQKDEVFKKQDESNKQKDQIIEKQGEIIKQKDEVVKQKDDVIKQKDDVIKQNDDMIKLNIETIKQKDEIISQKDNIIQLLEDIIQKKNYIEEKEEFEKQNKEKGINDNKISKDFNIVNHEYKNKLSCHGNKTINTILQLQDGRLASGGNDGSVIIYNKQTFIPEIIIKDHTKSIYDIIQLKNGNLLSCSYHDKKMNEYKINENNTYKVLSSINAGKDNNPYKIVELQNNEIGLVAYNHIIFYTNINNNLNENFKIKYDNRQIGQYFEMICVTPEELVISGNEKKIQFFELKSRKLKEIIRLNRNICWSPCNLLCMMNERCLCIGGENKISIIDVYNKTIINEIKENGINMCLYKLNNTTLLSGNDNGEIVQWKIDGNNLYFLDKKEKAHKNCIRDIIRFNNSIISCSDDCLIKIW